MKRALLGLLLIASIARGEEHPNDSRGFSPNGVYDTHDIDTVNTFNGNLTVRIPIGPTYTVNGLVSYQYQLYYNSHPYKYDETTYPQSETEPYAISLRRPYNAGLGWMLSLGEYGVETAGLGRMAYYSPDGAEHPFEASGYTADGSNLRLRTICSTEVQIDFPNGTTHVFWRLQPGTNPWPASATGTVWRLREIRSQASCSTCGGTCTLPVDNRVTITYSTEGTYQEVWTVQETTAQVPSTGAAQSYARQSKVYFDQVSNRSQFENRALARIELPTPPGGTASTYTFAHTETSVNKPAYPGTIAVVLLTRVTQPTANGTAATYDFTVPDGGNPPIPAYATSGADSGLLNKVTLPTKGSITWTYDIITFPGSMTGGRGPAIAKPTGVYQRKTFKPDGTEDGTWTYRRLFQLGTACAACEGKQAFACGVSRQMTSWVQRPGTSATTASFFSTYDPNVNVCDPYPSGWSQKDYGLPFTPLASRAATDSDPVPIRYLSTQVLDSDPFNFQDQWTTGDGLYAGGVPGGTAVKQSTYVTYAAQSGSPVPAEPRLTSSITVNNQDTGCGTNPCYTATNLYHYNGYGAFQQTSTLSNIPGDDQYRTSWTGYAPIVDSTRWILHPWDKQCVRRDTAPASAITIASACTGWSLVTHAQYGTTGLLAAQRVFANGDTASTHDLLATNEYDAKGLRSKEKFAGGDAQTLSTSNEFTISTPAYEIDYTAQYSTTGALEARTGSYTADGTDVLLVLNETYNPATGLVTATSDPAGVTTKYTYDERYRLKSTTVYTDSTSSTPASTPTTYTYADAGTATPPKVTVTRASSTAGTVQQIYEYDGFGRLTTESRLMPDGTTTKRQTTYTAFGAREKISEYETTPTHFTVFSAFDAFDRPTIITPPDHASTHERRTLYEFTGTRIVKRKQQIGTTTSATTEQTTTETHDALGRIRTITQNEDAAGTNTINARYSYDVAGHLAKVEIGKGTPPSAPTYDQERTFTYDARGFLTSEQPPELNGLSIYYGGYDAKGHVGSKQYGNASGRDTTKDTSYTYDHAERLTSVKNADNNPIKEFTYAPQNDTTVIRRGKLVAAIRYNRDTPSGTAIIVTTTYGYDAIGRVSSRSTKYEHLRTPLGAGEAWPTTDVQYAYNDLDLVSTIQYPMAGAWAGSTWDWIKPQYANGAFATARPVAYPSTTLTDFTTGNITYWPNGMVKTITHNNSVVDEYEEDKVGTTATGMPRPGKITFTGWTNVCAAPTITITNGSGQYMPGDPSRRLSITVDPLTATLQWYQGTTPITGATGTYLDVSPTQTTNYFVRATATCGTTTDSNTITVTVKLKAPQALLADHNVNSSQTTPLVDVTWQAVTGATSYQVYREAGGTWAPLTPVVTTTSFIDAPPAGGSYMYKVKALATNALASDDSAQELESTLTFTSITTNSYIEFAHIEELRFALNQVRWTHGDAALSWAQLLAGNTPDSCSTAPVPQENGEIYAAHILSLRCAMDAALTRLGMSTPSYTDGVLTNVFIKAVHFTELQDVTDAKRNSR